MEINPMRKGFFSIVLISLLLLGGSAYAADGLSLSATTLKVNDELTATFSSSTYCKIQMKVLGLENQGMVFTGPAEAKTFNPPAQYKVKFTKAGKYRVWAEKLDNTTGICGKMTLSDMQKDIQVILPLSPGIVGALAAAGTPPPGQCPDGYTKDSSTPSDQVKKGALRCVKTPASCPQGWTGSTDPGTGALICTLANPPACPPGWHGNIQNGKLTCNPLQPAKLNCPANTPDWEWGTKYYSESWNVVGCTPNVKPAF